MKEAVLILFFITFYSEINSDKIFLQKDDLNTEFIYVGSL
jgi:hypothetical protein